MISLTTDLDFYVAAQQTQSLWNTILEFLSDNKENLPIVISIVTLLLGSGALIALFRFIWWGFKKRRARQIRSETFPFQVIPRQSGNVPKQLLGGEDDNVLADRNIPYQARVAGRNIGEELEQHLDEHRWVLIVGPSGTGKTREAVNLAHRLCNRGWTIVNFTGTDWLDAPARFPSDKINTDRNLLFFFDDLNRKMLGAQVEQSPRAEDDPLQPMFVPFQERLLRTLEFYEQRCGKEEIRVIATARNEQIPDRPDETSPWGKLEWDKYSNLWQKFYRYPLPEIENEACVQLLKKTTANAEIRTNAGDYPWISQNNDGTFRNIIENLRDCKRSGEAVSKRTFQTTSQLTWSRRYRKVIDRYPGAKYVYAAVDLLRTLEIDLYPFTIAATAQMIARGNPLQKVWHWWQIHLALRYLIANERILNPRDGQIEARNDSIEWWKYLSPLTRLILKLTKRYPEQLLSSLSNFGYLTGILEESEKALALFSKIVEIKPNDYKAWTNRGLALDNLGRTEDAIASYDKAIEIKPDLHEAWFNRGLALANLGRTEDAITSYDKAIEIKPDLHEAWFNRGVALDNLGRTEDAIASYDKAIAIKPDLHEAWFNRGIALDDLGRTEDAITSYDKAIEIKPDDHEAWFNRGVALADLGRTEDAIASYDKAIEIKPDEGNAFYIKACCLAKQGEVDLAIEALRRAIELSPDEYRELAKTDTDFDGIRDDKRFQRLLAGTEEA